MINNLEITEDTYKNLCWVYPKLKKYKLEEVQKFFKELEKETIVINQIGEEKLKNKLIAVIQLSFTDVALRGTLYEAYFAIKDFPRFVLSSSGGFSFLYGISGDVLVYYVIMNSENKYLNPETIEFILYHEYGHIIHGDCDSCLIPNEKKYKLRNKIRENLADYFAISHNCKINNSARELALHEAYSLLPKNASYHYSNYIIDFSRFRIFIRHWIACIIQLHRIKKEIKKFYKKQSL